MKMQSHKLLHKKTGAEILTGSTVTDFRGEQWKVAGFEPPRHDGSTGRVYLVQWDDPDKEPTKAEFYPGVIDAEIITLD